MSLSLVSLIWCNSRKSSCRLNSRPISLCLSVRVFAGLGVPLHPDTDQIVVLLQLRWQISAPNWKRETKRSGGWGRRWPWLWLKATVLITRVVVRVVDRVGCKQVGCLHLSLKASNLSAGRPPLSTGLCAPLHSSSSIWNQPAEPVHLHSSAFTH